jgi:hypothetical protein
VTTQTLAIAYVNNIRNRMTLLQLWLPILVTAIGVFFASSLVHMVFKWHNAEYRLLPNEDDVRKVLGAAKLDAGL